MLDIPALPLAASGGILFFIIAPFVVVYIVGRWIFGGKVLDGRYGLNTHKTHYGLSGWLAWLIVHGLAGLLIYLVFQGLSRV